MPTHWNTHCSHDLARTRTFYEALGFTVQAGPQGAPCVVVKPAPEVAIYFFQAAAFAEPWGYAGGFSDPDGHVWAALWMPT